MPGTEFWFVDRQGAQQVAPNNDALFAAVARGDVTGESQLYDPRVGAWQPARSSPLLAACFVPPARSEAMLASAYPDPQELAARARRKQLTFVLAVLALVACVLGHPESRLNNALGLLFIEALFLTAPYRWGGNDRRWRARLALMAVLAAVQVGALILR